MSSKGGQGSLAGDGLAIIADSENLTGGIGRVERAVWLVTDSPSTLEAGL